MSDFDRIVVAHYVAAKKMLQFDNKDDANAINHYLPAAAQLKKGQNVPLNEHVEAAMVAILESDDAKAKNALLSAMKQWKDPAFDKDTISKVLLAFAQPQHDVEQAAETMLQSPLLNGVRDGLQGTTARERLQNLSTTNLARYDREISEQKERLADVFDKNHEKMLRTIKKAVAEIEHRYDGASYVHASNKRIEGHILTATDRGEIETYSAHLSGSQKKEKTNHTAEMNAGRFYSHDCVFFNVYADVRDEHLRATLKSTRYLKQAPELTISNIAPEAQSFLYRANHLFGHGNERLLVATMRDPVYPAGGKNADEAVRKRVGQGVGTYLSHEEGGFTRRVGDTVERYRTSENIFVGEDIPVAMKKNVELGIYRTLASLGELGKADKPESARAKEQAQAFFTDIRTLGNPDAPREARDAAMEALVKTFQYPQLMVVGAVQTVGLEGVRTYRVSEGIRELPMPQQAQGVAQGGGPPQVVQAQMGQGQVVQAPVQLAHAQQQPGLQDAGQGQLPQQDGQAQGGGRIPRY